MPELKTVLERYRALIATRQLRPDPEQAGAAARLDALHSNWKPVRAAACWGTAGAQGAVVRGLYMWGGVGRGKSMLMDLFHDTLAIREKRRCISTPSCWKCTRFCARCARARTAIPSRWPRASPMGCVAGL
jgi:predicted ATPase